MFPPCHGDTSGKLVAVVDTSVTPSSAPTVRAKMKALNDLSQMDKRTRPVRLVTDFSNQIEVDLGGDLSEAQKVLVRGAAVINAVLQGIDDIWASTGNIDLTGYCTASNSLRRICVTLGVRRTQRDAGVVELMEHD